MKMHTKMLRVGLLGVTAGAAFAAAAVGQSRQDLGFGTSASGGTGYMYAVAMATVINDASEDLKITPFPTAGVVENDRLLRMDEAQIILHTGGEAYDSFRGEGRYESAFEGMRAILPIYASLVQMIVPDDSGINAPADLAGRRVGLGEPGSSANTYVRQVLAVEGVNDGDYDARPNSLTEMVAGVRDGNLDALTTVMGAGAPALQDLATSREVRVLSLSEETLQGVMEQNPPGAVVPVTIDAGTYPGQDADVQTFGVPLWIIVRAEMPDADVEQLLSLFLSNIDRAREVHPVVNGTTHAFVAGATPPVQWHPAAPAALEAAGYEYVPFGG